MESNPEIWGGVGSNKHFRVEVIVGGLLPCCLFVVT